MSATQKPPPPSPASAGWYRDPVEVNTQRYWNGEAWTDQVAPATPPPPPPASGTDPWTIAGGVLVAVFVLWFIAANVDSCQADAAEVGKLRFREAVPALLEWSVAQGATSQTIQRCRRESPRKVRCAIRESGWHTDPSDPNSPVAENVWSYVKAAAMEDGSIRVWWFDYVYCAAPRCSD